MRLTSALCLFERNIRGFGLPLCSNIVTPPISVKERPIDCHPLIAHLSYPFQQQDQMDDYNQYQRL